MQFCGAELSGRDFAIPHAKKPENAVVLFQGGVYRQLCNGLVGSVYDDAPCERRDSNNAMSKMNKKTGVVKQKNARFLYGKFSIFRKSLAVGFFEKVSGMFSYEKMKISGMFRYVAKNTQKAHYFTLKLKKRQK